ncbi:hypothetical protein TRFO_30573 [Tritrichomonas foetus]|uniref:protein-serine/threonine phosphatase n=1 Tax=Tritrichomonas foetus TaxID=1144522 RepID=A0A1J4JVB6_9EUKA|nr:hypothetical protein TRFO_30573 [Tritrichomonas foetus]|eukprot:OHT02376.1 hypothetical protein TRFO_30573 [Tritrichomonas foetus]
MSDKAVKVFGAFRQVFVAAKDLPSNAEIHVPIPKFDYNTLFHLVEITASILVKQQNVVQVEPPVYVIGDIKGNVIDLVRILTKTESFTNHRFIFLGNYFDNFMVSEDIVALLTSIIILFPHNVYLLRSNTDIALNNSRGMDPNLFEGIRNMLSLCPLGAIVKNRFYCSADGVPIDQPLISHLLEIERPNNDIMPTFGYQEDFAKIMSFFQKNNIKKVIRGGEVVPKGIEKGADGHIIMIFSCTNYQHKRNRGGFVFISAEGECKGYNIPVTSSSKSNKPAHPSAGLEPGQVVRDKKIVFKMNFTGPLPKAKKGASALKPRKIGSMALIGDHGRRRSIQGMPKSSVYDQISNINPDDVR